MWNLVENKTTRHKPDVFERHAFFAACTHNGYGLTELSKVTGYHHSTVYYSKKMHEINLSIPYYKRRYEFFLNYNNLPTELNSVEAKIRELFKTRQRLKKSLKNLEKALT